MKILDFGLAKIDTTGGNIEGSAVTAVRRDEITTAGTTLGTVSYMSPEQARGQLTDSRTDLFSLVLVLETEGINQTGFKATMKYFRALE